jgi:hypothetical protein
VDQAHEQISYLGTVLAFIEECVLAMQNDFFERALADIVVQGRSRLAQEERQLPPVL